MNGFVNCPDIVLLSFCFRIIAFYLLPVKPSYHTGSILNTYRRYLPFISHLMISQTLITRIEKQMIPA